MRRGEDRGSRPVPDPTVLTTQALEREVHQLEASIARQVRSIEHELDTRFSNLDRLVAERLDRTEAFRLEQKSDNKEALASALQAQKEAALKTETAVNKQLSQLLATLDTAVGGLRASIEDVKERVETGRQVLQGQITEVDRKATAIAQQKIGATEDRSGLYATVAVIATVIIVAIAIVGFIASRAP